MGYRKERERNIYVSWIYESDTEQDENLSRACYAELFRQIPDHWTSILLKEDMGRVAYDEPEIKRWVNDLNELNLPCHLEGVDETVRIRLVISEFASKLQFCSTLQLLRCLWESNYDKIPEAYFEILDKVPLADKVEAIQVVHKTVGTGGGHGVTGIHNGKTNVDRKTLLERLIQGPGPREVLVWGTINEAWRAADAKPKSGGYGYE